MSRTPLGFIVGAVGLLSLAAATPARAADPVLEIGTSLATVVRAAGESDTVFIVPNGAPWSTGLFVSAFLGRHVAVEPQISFVGVVGDESDSFYSLVFVGQASYFVKPAGERSAFVFGGVGTNRSTYSITSRAVYHAGGGYRVPVGDTLAVRVDARWVSSAGDAENVMVFTVSMGGIFARR